MGLLNENSPVAEGPKMDEMSLLNENGDEHSASYTKESKVDETPVVVNSFWREFSPLLFMMWPHLRGPSTALFVSQVSLALMYAWSYNYYAELTGTFATSIQENDKNKFIATMFAMVFSVVLGSFANATILFLGDLQCFEYWFGNLSKNFLRRYLRPLVYYKVLPSVPDPDQRISHDIYKICEKLKLILFGTPMYIGAIALVATTTWFTITLWIRGGWLCPILTYAYFTIFTFFNQSLVISVSKEGKAHSQKHGDYRFAHTYLRLHAEHVAFLDGHAVEERKLSQLLSAFVNHARAVALRTYPLNTCSQIFYWGSSCMAYLIPGIVWWTKSGKDNFSVEDFIAVSTIIGSLMYQLSTLMLLSQEVAELVGITSRVAEMSVALDEAHETLQRDHLGGNRLRSDDSVVSYNDVAFATPGNKLTIRHVTFQVPAGGKDNLLIMGPSGIGKSSILRVLGGLWPVLEGTLTKPLKVGRQGVTYMPQKPYLTLGTLKEQITYPERATVISDEEALDLLRVVELDYIVTREPGLLHMTKIWSETLSGGEAQRVGVARILHQQPTFAVLDECTSAMDENIEAKSYAEMCRRGITLISVAHRSTVKRFHHRLFLMAADGTWTLQQLQ